MRGFTLVEVFISIAIFAAVSVAVFAFYANTLSNQQVVSGSLQTAQNAENILKTMLVEIRSMVLGANGVYPLVTAGTSTLTFFSSPVSTSTIEEITYALQGTTLYRSVIVPSGLPVVYNPANQSTTTIMTGVYNATSAPIFQYYDQNYTGTSSPLTQPVVVSSVTLIKITLTLNANPSGRSPSQPRTYSTQAALRNLKTNL
jgi:prepilin-type N-terminal cleavage/methylation domain-containing protein